MHEVREEEKEKKTKSRAKVCMACINNELIYKNRICDLMMNFKVLSE